MFQFGRFPSSFKRMTRLEPRRVSPFGYLRLSRSYTPHRSFSQYNTSFFGTRYLGIHCVPLVAFRTLVRSLRLSWHALLRYYLRVDYSTVKTHRLTFRQPQDCGFCHVDSHHVKYRFDRNLRNAAYPNTSCSKARPVSNLVSPLGTTRCGQPFARSVQNHIRPQNSIRWRDAEQFPENIASIHNRMYIRTNERIIRCVIICHTRLDLSCQCERESCCLSA